MTTSELLRTRTGSLRGCPTLRSLNDKNDQFAFLDELKPFVRDN